MFWSFHHGSAGKAGVPGLLCTGKAQDGMGQGARLLWQAQSSARGRETFSRAAPNRLKRHPVVGGIHKGEHPGFGIVPEHKLQRVARGRRAQVFGIPMRQTRLASQRCVCAVIDRQCNSCCTIGSVNDAGIRHIGPALR